MRNVLSGEDSGGSMTVAMAVIFYSSYGVPIVQHHSPTLTYHLTDLPLTMKGPGVPIAIGMYIIIAYVRILLFVVKKRAKFAKLRKTVIKLSLEHTQYNAHSSARFQNQSLVFMT